MNIAAIETISINMGLPAEVFDGLIRDTQTPKITLLVPPRAPGHPVAEDETRIRAMITAAIRQLVEADMYERSAKTWFNGLVESVDHKGADSASSRAIFVSPERRVVTTVPIDLGEDVIVGEAYALTPLAPLVKPARFVLVALTRSGVAAAIANKFGYEPLDLPDAPSGIQEVTQYADIERQLQSHSVGGSQAFHGHGGLERKAAEDLHRYARMVETAVEKAVGNGVTTHAVIAPPALVSEYRKVVSNGSIDVVTVATNPSSSGLNELHQRAVAELGDALDEARPAIDLYNRVAGSSRALHRLPGIIEAARQGKVHAFLFNPDWGMVVDPLLIETAALETWRHGGEVHRTHQIEAGAAVLRY